MKNSIRALSGILATGVVFLGQLFRGNAADFPIPSNVLGKEYTDNPDINAQGDTTKGQILVWAGDGSVSNGSRMLGEVDALASLHDPFFREVAFFNSASLLISVKGDSPANSIWFESPTGSRGVWATKSQINAAGVGDLDSLHIGGPSALSDSVIYSRKGDPDNWPIGATVDSGAVLRREVLADAIGLRFGATVNGVFLDGNILGQARAQVQLDALMYDYRGSRAEADMVVQPGNPPPLSWVYADDILFSIEPILVTVGNQTFPLFDGGEIWTYNLGGIENNYVGAPAQFLNHGGHLWNTSFDVRWAFGVESEDIDALAAVAPIPEFGADWAVVLFGLIAGAELVRRRRFVHSARATA